MVLCLTRGMQGSRNLGLGLDIVHDRTSPEGSYGWCGRRDEPPKWVFMPPFDQRAASARRVSVDPRYAQGPPMGV